MYDELKIKRTSWIEFRFLFSLVLHTNLKWKRRRKERERASILFPQKPIFHDWKKGSMIHSWIELKSFWCLSIAEWSVCIQILCCSFNWFPFESFPLDVSTKIRNNKWDTTSDLLKGKKTQHDSFQLDLIKAEKMHYQNLQISGGFPRSVSSRWRQYRYLCEIRKNASRITIQNQKAVKLVYL